MIAVRLFTPLPTPRRFALVALAAIASALSLDAPAATTTGEPAPPAAISWAEQVQHSLPAGWTVAPVAAGQSASWLSLDPTALATFQIHDGRQTHRVSLVPLNWIAVQAKPGPGEFVRRGPTAKVIVAGDAAALAPWLDTFAPWQASLASPQGNTDAFAGAYPRVEAEVRTLLRKTSATREQAAASLIALGVPAEDLIRETALGGRGALRVAAVRSLRHFPGKATREAIHKIIADKSRDSAADTCRLAALDTCQALMLHSHGPAVAAALQMEKDEATAARLAEEINRLRYGAAAPELRRWLKSAQTPETRVACARALATVRDTAAAAEIRAVLNAPRPRRAAVAAPTDAAARRHLEIELHRLTGTWGDESYGTRLGLTFQSPDRVLVHVENMGSGPLHFLPYAEGSAAAWPVGLEVTLDGEVVSPAGPRDADLGSPAALAQGIPTGSATCFELPLSTALTANSEHVVRAHWFGASANELVVRVSQ